MLKTEKSIVTYIGLGSNLNNPAQQLQHAITKLAAVDNIEVCQISNFYKNKALIHPDRPNESQPDFVNAVISLTTQLTPSQLLAVCLKTEAEMGRLRGINKWEARVIDIDILLYGNKIIHSAVLTVPHPEIYNRMFVLKPLAEIAPELVFPDGTQIQQALNKLQETRC